MKKDQRMTKNGVKNSGPALLIRMARYSLMTFANSRGGIEPSLDFFRVFFEINIFVFIIVSRVV